MSDTITVRRAVFNDLATIVAFNQAMASETEDRMLPEETIKAGVEGLFYSPQYGFYMVACDQNEVVGSLLVTFEWSDWRNGIIWWIQSVYIKPQWRRRGIYRKLYKHVKTLAAAQGSVRGFRLYVEKENHTAQHTYANLGMQESDYLLYEEMLDER